MHTWRDTFIMPFDTERLKKLFLQAEKEGRKFGFERPGMLDRTCYVWIGPQPKQRRPLCGARTRKGTPCQCRAMPYRERCRLHGGLSTGPKTTEGRARIAESNRRRAELRRMRKAEPQKTSDSGGVGLSSQHEKRAPARHGV